MLAVPDIFVHLFFEIIIIIVCILLLICELDAYVGLTLAQQLFLVSVVIKLNAPCSWILHAVSPCHQLRQLHLALLQRLLHGLVRHIGDRFITIKLDHIQLLGQVANARLHVDEHFCHTLESHTVSLELLSGLRQMNLKVVDDLPTTHVPTTGELQILHLKALLAALLKELIYSGLVLLGQVGQVLVRVLLCEELLDHLIHITDTCGFFDAVEGFLIVQELLPLFLGIVIGDTRS
mmetsp:Transcript_27882/g.48528  ORF Transcript_27882/g.48528 Transcript_27882/m.48528 type:complete len:235 (+) Transcript_27882:254-958(+)